MEELGAIYNYLLGPVDAVVQFGGAVSHSLLELGTDLYKSLLR